MKKEVVLKAVELLNKIDTIGNVISAIKFTREIGLRDKGNRSFGHVNVNVENGVNEPPQFYYFSIPKEAEEVIQEVTERYLSLLVIRLQAEQKRIEASLESFNEDDFYRSQLFNKMEEAK